MNSIPNSTTRMTPPFVRRAGTPFDRQDADVILRSEDGVDFRTFRAHLSSASDVFSFMFSSLQPPSDEKEDGLPIVPLYDPSPILNRLLCYCDPDLDPRSSSVPLIDVQKLAVKYDMMSVARNVYRDRTKLERDPLPSRMLNVIGQQVGQDENMYFAAVNIFTASENDSEEKDLIDLDFVSQTQFDSLVGYRDKCRAAAVAIAHPPHNHYTWIDPESVAFNWFRTGVEHVNCNRGGNVFIASVQGKSMMSYWWRLYMEEAARRLKERPWGSTVTSGDFFAKALEEGSRCDVCREGLGSAFRDFTNKFAREIDNAVSKARHHTSNVWECH